MLKSIITKVEEIKTNEKEDFNAYHIHIEKIDVDEKDAIESMEYEKFNEESLKKLVRNLD